MRGEIADQLGDPDDSRWTTEIEKAIVAAIEHFRARPFWFLDDRAVSSSDVTSATVSGTEYYSFPSSPQLLVLDEPNGLRVLADTVTPYPLERISWEEAQAEAVNAATASGPPASYAVRGDQIRLLPIPDDAYTLYWSGRFAPTTTITVGGGDSQTNVWMTTGAALIRNHAKKIVARDTLHDGVRAAAAEAAEMEADEALSRENMLRKKRRIKPWGA